MKDIGGAVKVPCASLRPAAGARTTTAMSDLIFIGATVVFFAICALYVHWCDKIIGPEADAGSASGAES